MILSKGSFDSTFFKKEKTEFFSPSRVPFSNARRKKKEKSNTKKRPLRECRTIPTTKTKNPRNPKKKKTAAVQMSYYFDLQKEKVATHNALTHFIPKPAIQLWMRAKVYI